MPKLNATVNDIELKTNKVIGSLPSSDWTDDQYPSAKTLYDTYDYLLNLVHPVGSMYITTSNINPESTLGGTWRLAEKSFAPLTLKNEETTAPAWIATNATLGGNSYIRIIGNSIFLRLYFTTTAEYTGGTLNLGTFDTRVFGLSELPYGIHENVAFCSSTNAVLSYRLSSDGVLSIRSALNPANTANTKYLPAGTKFFININLSYPSAKLDSFCNKFTWQRTA